MTPLDRTGGTHHFDCRKSIAQLDEDIEIIEAGLERLSEAAASSPT